MTARRRPRRALDPSPGGTGGSPIPADEVEAQVGASIRHFASVMLVFCNVLRLFSRR